MQFQKNDNKTIQGIDMGEKMTLNLMDQGSDMFLKTRPMAGHMNETKQSALMNGPSQGMKILTS